MIKRVLNAYNELKDNGIDLMLLKNIIELNTDKKLNKGWYFIEEGNISGYDYFILANTNYEPNYLTAYIELDNKLTKEQVIEIPANITFNDIGARGKYCIGIDQNHIWNDTMENHLDLDDCRTEIKKIIDWLLENNKKSLDEPIERAKKIINELTFKAAQKFDTVYDCKKIEGNTGTDDFFDCFEILQLYNTLKREGSYEAELDGDKIKIELDTGLCTLEKKDNKYHLFGDTINESFDIIWDLFNYLGKHYKRQYIRINNVETSETDDRIYWN